MVQKETKAPKTCFKEGNKLPEEDGGTGDKVLCGDDHFASFLYKNTKLVCSRVG